MLNYELIINFMLIFARVSAFIMVIPVFGGSSTPRLVKIGISFVLAVLLLPLVASPASPLTGGLIGFALAVIKETAVGLLMGLICVFILNSLIIAGQLFDMHIGFMMSNFFDPVSGSQTTLLANFLYLLGLTLFLTMNGHYMVISGLFKSFQMVPLAGAEFKGDTALLLIRVFANMITIGVQICLPVIAVAMIIDVSLGLMGKTAPQMNIFMLGFPIKIAAGIAVLAVMVPLLGVVFQSLFRMMEQDLYTLYKGLN